MNLFLHLIQYIHVVVRRTSPEMATVLPANADTKFAEMLLFIQKKKNSYKTNQGSNFLRGSFSNASNARILIQFNKERQS